MSKELERILKPSCFHLRWWSPFWVAFALVAIGVGVRLGFLQILGTRATFITLYPAVILAALYGGFAPGVFATLLSAVAASYFWMEPVGSFAIGDPADWISLALFIASGTLISWIARRLHATQSRLATVEARLREAHDPLRAAALRREEETLAHEQIKALFPINAIVPVGLLLLAGVGWLAYRNTLDMVESDRQEHHTYDVIGTLEAFQARVESLETHLRGFVISSNEDYLPSKDINHESPETILARLKQLTQDNPREQACWAELESVLARKQVLSQQVIQARRSQGFEAARQLTSQGQDRQLMEEIRRLAGEGLAMEDHLLHSRIAAKRTHAQRVAMVLLAGGLLGLSLLGAAFFLLRRENLLHLRVAKQLEFHQGNLAELVAERTRELAATNASLTQANAQREAVEAVNARLAAIVESSDDAIMSLSMNGIVQTWNQGAERLFEYRAEEIIGHSILRLLPSERQQEEQEILVRIESGLRIEHYDTVRVAKSGRRIDVSLTVSPLEDKDGRVIGVSKIARDITERKRNELALHDNEARLSSVVGSAMDAIISVNSDQRIVLFNAAAEQMFQCPAAQALGQPLDPFLPPAARAAHHQQVEDFGKTGVTNRRMGRLGTVRGRRLNGEEFPIEASISHVEMSGQKLFTVILRDITERLKAEAAIKQLNAELEERVRLRTRELETTNRELEAFCYSVSHDLRAPLRSVDGFSQAIVEDYAAKLDEEAKAMLERVRAGCRHMGRLIDDLLNLSRLSRAQMLQVPVDLTALAEEIVHDLRHAQPERQVDVQIARDLQATGDPGLIRALLTNLLSNAWKFTGQAPAPRIEFGKMDAADHVKTGTAAVFYVRDNGAGFDMKYADKLFAPFQRLHSAAEFPGSGIGLAIVQRVVQRHGGAVCVEAAPGAGATFFFTLQTSA